MHNQTSVDHVFGEELRVLRRFKGNSDATIILATDGRKSFIRKFVPHVHAPRLQKQYQWLQKHHQLSYIVNAIGEKYTATHYAIDLEYQSRHVSLFDYIHSHTLSDTQAILEDIWAYMFTHVYRPGTLREHPSESQEYIRSRLEDRLSVAAAAHPDLRRSLQENHLYINDTLYDNYPKIMRRIQNSSQAWHDIITYRAAPVIHGDMTVSNILIDPISRQPLIIDPSDDNQMSGPMLDFARHMQSWLFGFESLDIVAHQTHLNIRGGIPAIHIKEYRSLHYKKVCDYVTNRILPKYLEEPERRAILFHVGLFYARILAHRIKSNPNSVLSFYAISIMALNQFMDQYI